MGKPVLRGIRDLYRKAAFEAAEGTYVWGLFTTLWELATLGSTLCDRKGNTKEKDGLVTTVNCTCLRQSVR